MANTRTDGPQLTFNGAWYCQSQQTVIGSDGSPIVLRPQSLAVFRYLSENYDTVVSKQSLFDNVWPGLSVTDDSLVQCVRDIRLALGDADKRVLRVIPKRGYCLIADTEPNASSTKTQSAFSKSGRSNSLLATLSLVGMAFAFWYGYKLLNQPVLATMPSVGFSATRHQADAAGREDLAEQLNSAARRALSKYRTIAVLEDSRSADYQITSEWVPDGSGGHFQIELVEQQSKEIFFAESWPLITTTPTTLQVAADSIAAAIASPAGGAIGLREVAMSRGKPVDALTPAECYAHGYSCQTCSGEQDFLTPRASACVAKLLEANPNDARAWALEATILTWQYWFGVNLSPEQRNDPEFLRQLPVKARQAADRAESLTDGTDSLIYWGLAHASMAACDREQLSQAISRGLRINPNDPNLLGSFGMWLTFTGDWDNGVAMVERALALQPKQFKPFWLYAPAKRHFKRKEYQQALNSFRDSFNNRNWLSHLQLAYTLPYLNRIDDARNEVTKLKRLYPGFSNRHAVDFYRMFCFDDEYTERVSQGLKMAGLM